VKKNLIASAIVIALGITTMNVASAVTLPTNTKAKLIYLADEEKLARDTYATLYAKTGIRQFANINQAEQIHMALVQGLLKTYGIKDPTLGKAVGSFYSASLTAFYKKLVAQGSVSAIEALKVGILIENKDIADVSSLAKSNKIEDVAFVLDRLIQGSKSHLAAFSM